MRCVICGSRGINDYELLKRAIKESGFDITEVVSGNAVGVDLLGERWAEENGIKLHRFPAEWHLHGRAAGYIRNRQLVKFVSPPECQDGGVITLWDGESRGTVHTINLARDAGVKLFVKSPPFHNEVQSEEVQCERS